ncbi:MAG: molybdopterin oxidoreductase [Rhodobacteraceae bacterium]|nr:molybdopterin oxidoreductase [Paracoccaceae bacterium]
MERIVYRELRSTPKVWGVMALCAAFVAAAGAVVLYVEHHGHIVTGMNNQIVWGVPHVFAIFLIIAASGALNVSSIGSVFGKMAYKPVARLANLLAVSLLLGGLAVLVLDLGRPDRLVMAMYTYNFTSIFAWNILLYSGFMGVVAVYLYTLMARNVDPRALKAASLLAFVWRLALTTGTGSIFGWLVARTAYDSAIMAPMFIAMSFSFGMAMFMLVMILTTSITRRVYSPELRTRQARLLGVFVAAVLYFVIVHHLSNIYLAKKGAYESWILLNGGIYTALFWVGQVLIGGIIPMILLFHPKIDVKKGYVLLAALLVVLGGFAQLYVIIVGGQAFPLEMFPGFEVSSGFSDGVINEYTPEWIEFVLGFGGIALALMIAGLGMKFLRIVPENLSDDNVDPSLLAD